MKQALALLNIKQVAQRIGLSKSSIYRRLNPKEKLYDPNFPKPVKIGDTTTRWVECEIEAWLQEIIEHRRYIEA